MRSNSLSSNKYRTAVSLWIVWGLAAGPLCAAPPAATGFSADIIRRDAAGSPVAGAAKIYVADGKVRIETAEAPDGYFVVDGVTGAAVFVHPARQLVIPARQSTPLTQIFVPVDPDDPCRQWQAAAERAADEAGGRHTTGWHCERRATGEYEVTSPAQPLTRRWVDPSLRFPLRIQMSDGSSLELAHIRVTAERAELFAIPSSYRHLDPLPLIQRIMHSDVWVDSPGQQRSP